MIRYDKKFNSEITKAVKRYNAKIRYYEGLGVDILPEKVKVSEIKRDAKVRNDIRIKLKQLDRLNAKNIREVISGGELKTLYEHKKDVQRIANAKRKITREIKKLSMSSPTLGGKSLPISFVQMGSDEYLRLKAKREYLDRINLFTLDYNKYGTLQKNLERIESNYINPAFQNNILEMLKSIAYYYNYPKDKVNKLMNKIDNLTGSEFNTLFNKELSIKSIIDYYLLLKLRAGQNPYPEDTEKLKDVLDTLLENFDDLVNEKVYS